MTELQRGVEMALDKILKIGAEEQVRSIPTPEQLAKQPTKIKAPPAIATPPSELLQKQPPAPPPEEEEPPLTPPPEEEIPPEGELPSPEEFPVEIPLTNPDTGEEFRVLLMDDYSVWQVGGEQVGAYDPETGAFKPVEIPEPLWSRIMETAYTPFRKYGAFTAAPWIFTEEEEARFAEKGITSYPAKLAEKWRMRGELEKAEPIEEYMAEYEKAFEALPWWQQMLFELPLWMAIPGAAPARTALLARGGRAARVGAAMLKPVAAMETAPSKLLAKLRPKPPTEVPPVKGVPVVVRPKTTLPAASRIAERINMKPEGEAITTSTRLSRFYTAAWDDLYPIRNFTKQAAKAGVKVTPEEDPYVLARLMRGIKGRVNNFLTRATFGRNLVDKGKSLRVIVKPVIKNLDNFRIYLVSRRAVALSERGIETGIKKADALKAVKELEKAYPQFKGTAGELYTFQRHILEYAQESGLLSKAVLNKILTKNEAYVPFYRVLEELQTRGFIGKRMANIVSPIKGIRGSQRELIDPLESIVKNAYAIIDAADRNQVGLMMAQMAEKNGVLSKLVTRIKPPVRPVARVTAEELGLKGFSDEAVNIFRPSISGARQQNVISVLAGGKRHYYKVDPDLYKALMAMEREDIGMLVQMMSYPAKWLRAGAVLSPDFWILRNPARDTMTAFVYSKYGFIPVVDTIRGVFSMLRADKAYRMWQKAGGERAMLVSLDRKYLQSSFKEVVGGKKFTYYLKHPLESLQVMAELTEAGTRIGEFRRGIARGVAPREAAFASREVSLDFAVIGAKTRAANAIIAFWNANMRAMDKLVREATQHPLNFYPKVIGGITIPSILLYFANRTDPRWDEIPQWQKDLFWIIMTEDNIYRIPKPFELGIIFGSMPERVLEYIDDNDPEVFDELMANLVSSLNPGYMPTGLAPIVENLTNYDFFLQRKIVPESQSNLPPELQYSTYTPEIIKKFGEWVNYSPRKIENLFRGYTAGLGNYAITGLDKALTGTGILTDIPEPSPTLADMPVVKAIVVRDVYGSASESVEKFYDELEELQKGESYQKTMLRRGERAKFEDYRLEHPEIMLFLDFKTGIPYSASARFLRRVARDISELRNKQREIYESKELTPEEKRLKVDEINMLVWEMAKLSLGHLEAMPEEFTEEEVVRPEVAEREVYGLMEIVPKYFRDYVLENREQYAGLDLSEQMEKWETAQDTDSLLIKQYDNLPDDTALRQAFRHDNPKVDVALNIWGRVKTVKSKKASQLLLERAEELNIPREILPGLVAKPTPVRKGATLAEKLGLGEEPSPSELLKR